MTCIHKFRRYCYFSIFVNPDEYKFLILIPKCIENKFEYVKRWTFSYGWKSKGVWSSRTYSHKIRGKSTYAFNIVKCNKHLKHEPRGGFRDISGWTYVNFSCLGQMTNRAYFFQVMEIFGRPSMSPFLVICFSVVIETWSKCWWIIWDFFKWTYSWGNNIPFSVRVDFDSFDLNIVDFFESGRVIPKKKLEGQQIHNVQ